MRGPAQRAHGYVPPRRSPAEVGGTRAAARSTARDARRERDDLLKRRDAALRRARARIRELEQELAVEHEKERFFRPEQYLGERARLIASLAQAEDDLDAQQCRRIRTELKQLDARMRRFAEPVGLPAPRVIARNAYGDTLVSDGRSAVWLQADGTPLTAADVDARQVAWWRSRSAGCPGRR